MHFSCREKKKKHKQLLQLLVGGNPTIICLHAPHYMKEDTTSIELDSRWQELTT